MRPRRCSGVALTQRPHHEPAVAAMNTERPPPRALRVLWPAFVGACALEMLVFAMVDPAALHWPGGASLALSDLALYSLAFFAFWAVVAAAVALAFALDGPAVNKPFR